MALNKPYILDAMKALDKCTQGGLTPLMMAVVKGEKKIFSYLLRYIEIRDSLVDRH